MNRRRNGFSLVEVTLALLVISVGMLSLFSLFPAGLRENILSRADLRQAAFAEYVFSRLEARAGEIAGDWDKWDNTGPFTDELASAKKIFTDDPIAIEQEWHKLDPNNVIRYRLLLWHKKGTRIWTACLQSTEVETGGYAYAGNPVYMTQVFFTGIQ
jgi:prepilin-type N-terminal cleavage/methylation domain-containing protein